MQNALINSSQAIAQYFNLASENTTREMAVFGQIIADILQTGMPVTNKAIISSLITRLEQENDADLLDIYRQLLEIVVQKTPDDVTV